LCSSSTRRSREATASALITCGGNSGRSGDPGDYTILGETNRSQFKTGKGKTKQKYISHHMLEKSRRIKLTSVLRIPESTRVAA